VRYLEKANGWAEHGLEVLERLLPLYLFAVMAMALIIAAGVSCGIGLVFIKLVGNG